ncbi:D site-binding protein [Habropoda laboriosa]|uniref:D site-binding protein n=1 Tax=Habropoda laboriosa TaxID=597456 RepID=A0A0L7QSV9_9HYME|nr:PREDICTED: protein giant-like [Habropoda laboriosa]KOC61715.1 D site-binding protein [Habropoda laboriosa]
MDSYSESPMDSVQALDFTSCGQREQRIAFTESILDLSCKKQTTTSTSNESNSPSSRSNSPAIITRPDQIGHFSDSERKSPFEGRTFMVTPPSESDSPRKIKYDSLYNCSETPANNVIGSNAGFSVLPMNVPIPVVPTVLPTLLSQNSETTKTTQIVGTSTPSTTTSTTYSKDISLSTLSPDIGKKAPRPFKAYPKDPLSLTVGTAEMMYDQNSTEAYSEFRKRMLESVRRSNEGTNIKMRRITKSPGLPTSTVDEKDAAYWERRRKNNEAAKRSRDARRAKEDEIAIRAAFLEQENMKLKYELVALRNETAKLRCMVYST